MGSRPECLLVVRLALRAVGKRTGLLDRLVGGLENLDTALVRFVRFVYDPGYVTANFVPVTLSNSPGVRCR